MFQIDSGFVLLLAAAILVASAAADGTNKLIYDDKGDVAAGSAQFISIAQDSAVRIICCYLDWHEVQTSETGSLTWNAVDERINGADGWIAKRGSVTPALKFILRVVNYHKSDRSDAPGTYGVPAWVYTTTNYPVAKVFLPGSSTLYIPRAWSPNMSYHYKNFLTLVSDRYTGTSPPSYASAVLAIWGAPGGYINHSTTVADDAWLPAVEQTKSTSDPNENWSIARWNAVLSDVSAHLETELSGSSIKPLFSVTPIFTNAWTEDEIYEVIYPLTKARLQAGSLVSFSGLDQDVTAYLNHTYSRMLCDLNYDDLLDSSQTIYWRNDFAFTRCADLSSSEHNLESAFKNSWADWNRFNFAFNTGVMLLGDDMLAAISGEDCYTSVVDDAIDDYFDVTTNDHEYLDGTSYDPDTWGMTTCGWPQGIIHVDPNSPGDSGHTDPHDGTSWQAAYTALSAAMNDPKLTMGWQIWVAKGTYKPAGSGRTAAFEIPNGVAVRGGFLGYYRSGGGETSVSQADPNANLCTLSGDLDSSGTANNSDSYHVVKFPSNVDQASLDGFTVTGGRANDTSATGENSKGGGVYVGNGARVQISRCKIAQNTAFQGGGIFVNKAIVHVTNVSLKANHAVLNTSYSPATQGGGGAACLDGSAAYFNNCVVHGNSAAFGGGVYGLTEENQANMMLFTNCTLYANSAQKSAVGGGAHCSLDYSFISRNSIWWANCANADGECVSGDNDLDAQISWNTSSSAAIFELRNSCVDTNGGGFSIPPFNDSNLTSNNIDDDPIFVSPGTGNLRLKKSGSPLVISPCIDAGLNNFLPTLELADLDKDGIRFEQLPKDLDLATRISCSTVDMGAYENPSCTQGMRQEGEGEIEYENDCYLDDGTDEELTERCAA